MSINTFGVRPPAQIEILNTPGIPLGVATHDVSADAFINTHVQVPNLPSVPVASINGSAQNSTNVNASLGSVSIADFNATVIGDPDPVNTPVQASTGVIQIFSNNTFIEEGSTPSGNQDLIIPVYTHENENLGSANNDIPGQWNEHNEGGTLRIENSDPLQGNSRYFQTTLVDPNERSERSHSDDPRGTVMDSVGGFWEGPQKFWYGFLMRVEAAPDMTSGHYCQWHTAESSGHSPNLSLRGRNGGLTVYLEDNLSNGGNDVNSGVILTRAQATGTVHAFVWEVFWSTNPNGNGLMRLYVDGNSSPAFEWIGANYRNDSARNPGEVPWFKWGLYYSGLGNAGGAGRTYRQSYDMFAVHGEDADRLGVLDSINWSQVN